MFSRQTLIILGVIVLIAVNITGLSITSRRHGAGSGSTAISLVAPFQSVVTYSLGSVRDLWRGYFDLVSVAKENRVLRNQLAEATAKSVDYEEIRLANNRLRDLLHFQKQMPQDVVAAEVIGKDPSPWSKTVIIDKGLADGLRKGFPVLVPLGVVGLVTEAAAHYAQVLLIIDRNSAVDALVQRTRARGIVRGQASNRCGFEYALRKDDIQVGDTVVSSGLDGVYPKGLLVGTVSSVIRRNSGMFQDVTVTPRVDFEKIEEVLVVLAPRPPRFETPR
jgi:rod shape-determining protein MreC